MHAFVGADRHGMRDFAQDAISARGQRLLDQRDALAGGKRKVGLDVVIRPPLVGVEDDAALRSGFRDGANPCHVVVAADLDLEQ